MTVRELIEWLATHDQDATVQVVKHDRRGSQYEQGGTASVETFTPALSDYTDFRGNQFTKPDAPHFDRRFLLLGESE